MRLPGSIEPGSAAGGVGHFAAWRRPNATVDTNAAVSCFVRTGRRLGGMVSAGPSATEGGGVGGGLAAAVSAALPSGGGDEPGVESRPAHDARADTVNTSAIFRTATLIRES